ncbi:MAG TPA: CRISPR system precrRNA processing endoribonuclease RAMP protein Cas6 [Bryobacteraceae bacterium]|nr:CRISPR system precrRNA processing endoribonuclease RAMP protein Cas6 [Bryobacteraceae bacterium]
MSIKTVSSHVSATGWFELYPLRFRFADCKLREFSPNTVRGAFGSALRRIDPDSYRRWFVPLASGPSGLAHPPRPFVFRLPGRLEIGLNLFVTRQPAVELFTRVIAELGTIESVEGTGVLRLPLAASCGPVSRIRVRFLTPTELKGAERPEFGVLLARVRDRISTLRALYGAGPLEIDFKAFGERARSVPMSRCELVAVTAERVSRRTGQRHSIGGFTGVVEYEKAEYEGDLAEFLPYLEIARWTGVGRQTVWGKGEIAYEVV